MWFKNFRVYRLTQSFDISPEALNEALAKNAFKPCGSLDPVKYGWSFPLGRHGSEYVHAANGYIMVCAKRQEKIVPSAVVNEALEDKVLEISNEESRHVSRAERQTLKDEIIFSLLPKALAKSSLDFAYIDPHNQLIVVNVGSAGRAEELISALREALGSLKAIPFTPMQSPILTMTDWVRNGVLPKGFELGEECELKSAKDGRTIRCKGQDLGADEVRQHIESGLNVVKLAFTWNEAISCVIDETMSFKRIKYDDEIYEKADNHDAESQAEQFDVEFAIMTVELKAFINAVKKAFGGIES